MRSPNERSARPGVVFGMVVVLALLTLGGSQVSASDTAPPVVYRLGAGASYQHGCFPPCLCPLLEAPMRGTFLLQKQVDLGVYQVFDVKAVNWRVWSGEDLLTITGQGTYTIFSEFAVLQRLELDLAVGDGELEHFDSGLVPGGNGFPALDIAVSINGFFCLDTGIEVVASPAGEVEPYRLLEGSMLAKGCYEPCSCPITIWDDVHGSFGLVPIGLAGGLEEFDVVKLRGLAESSFPSGSIVPITGFGTYFVGQSSDPPVHRLALELVVGAEPPTHFDSGLEASTVPLPLIATTVSINGLYCLDTGFTIVAAPRAGRGAN